MEDKHLSPSLLSLEESLQAARVHGDDLSDPNGGHASLTSCCSYFGPWDWVAGEHIFVSLNSALFPLSFLTNQAPQQEPRHEISALTTSEGDGGSRAPPPTIITSESAGNEQQHAQGESAGVVFVSGKCVRACLCVGRSIITSESAGNEQQHAQGDSAGVVL